MKSNQKVRMDPLEKHACRDEASADRRLKRRLWAIRIAVCVCLVVAVCLCAVLFDTIRLRAQTQAIVTGTDQIRIYIDQGHNPAPHHNSGAEGNGLYEQDLTFHIGRLLAELLEEDGRFAVCLSRPESDTVLGSDNASSLQARVDGAADFRADYLISLHINAYTQDTANGAEVLVVSGDRESYALGQALLDGLLDSTGLKDRGVKENSALYVLKNAAMPAVLLEMGFITNGGDAALLAEHPEWFARGIYNGILDYFDSPYAVNIYIWLGVLVMAVGMSVALIIAGFRVNKKRNLIAREKENAIAVE